VEVTARDGTILVCFKIFVFVTERW